MLKKMGPERDPPRPLGVKHKGTASIREQVVSHDDPFELSHIQLQGYYRLKLVLFHIKLTLFNTVGYEKIDSSNFRL